MKKLHSKTQVVFLLVLLSFIASCKGQVKTNMLEDNVNESKESPKEQPKMIRTQGVVSGNVHCELQDRAGNLWFSTGGEGVYRYDGTSFANFTTKDGLSDNNVNSIIEDRAGNILFGTKSGICKYDGKCFSAYSEIEALNKLPCLLEDKDGSLGFGTRGFGLSRYDGKNLTGFSS